MKMRVSTRVAAVLFFCFVFLPAAFPATKKPPARPIDINSANSAQLQEVPGIGPATAEKILQMRKSYGAFKSVDDLMAVRGIGPKRLEKMRKYLVAGHGAPGRRAGGSGASSARASVGTKPAACAVRTGASAMKKTAVAPAKTKPTASDGDAAGADEEPEQ